MPFFPLWLRYTLAFLCLLVSAWSFLWILSSVSLAGPPCNFEFSLFADSLRCREPYVATLLSALSLLLAIGLCLVPRTPSA